MIKIKAIIFDMDGVLINSTKYIWKSFNKILGEEGVFIDDKSIKKYLGFSLRDKLKLWKKDYGIKEYDLEEFSKRAGELEFSYYRHRLGENENLKTLLKELKGKGFKLAVATSSLRWRAEKILDLLGIKDYFEVIITAEDIEKHKPNPEIFLKVAKKLNVKPKNCVVIEDAASGIEAAKRGEMKVIALLTKFQGKEDLKEADLIIKHLDELNWKLINNL